MESGDRMEGRMWIRCLTAIVHQNRGCARRRGLHPALRSAGEARVDDLFEPGRKACR